MKFGNASWGFRETPLEEQFKITHDMGLHVLELGIANAPMDIFLDADKKALDAVKEMSEKYDVSIKCAATGNDFSTGSDSDLPKIKRVIEICEYLGVKYLRVFAGFSPVEEVTGARWDNMINCIKQSAEYADARGVVITIETHGGVNSYDDGVEHYMSTSSQPETLYKMLDELPETVKVNYDPANLWAVGIRNPEAVYEKIKDRVAVVHMKDFSALPSGLLKPSACGESGMDWDLILKAMSGFDGYALFEYENTEDISDGLQRSYNYIKEKLK